MKNLYVDIPFILYTFLFKFSHLNFAKFLINSWKFMLENHVFASSFVEQFLRLYFAKSTSLQNQYLLFSFLFFLQHLSKSHAINKREQGQRKKKHLNQRSETNSNMKSAHILLTVEGLSRKVVRVWEWFSSNVWSKEHNKRWNIIH